MRPSRASLTRQRVGGVGANACTLYPSAFHATPHRALLDMQALGTFGQEHTAEFLHICITLGKLGYVLTADEREWVRGDAGGGGKN